MYLYCDSCRFIYKQLLNLLKSIGQILFLSVILFYNVDLVPYFHKKMLADV